MPQSPHLTPAFFRFLQDLKKHNRRDWFQSRKAGYERDVRDPFLGLIAGLRTGITRVSPHFVVDPSPQGGSMMRIYRDIRFSKDKSPYKTAVAAQFWHAHGKEGMTPGFYLHLEPGRTFVGGGLWHPAPEGLQSIREAIVAQPSAWKKAVSGQLMQSGCGMVGESLKRPPQGFDPHHPLIEDLKRKDFALSVALPESELLGPGAVPAILRGVKCAAPFLRFLTEALGLPF